MKLLFKLLMSLSCLLLGLSAALAVSPFDGPPVGAPRTRIDELVFKHQKTLGIAPADLCSDSVFLRRVYLDVIGTVPTASEARAFYSDKDPAKRSKLIDKLLQRPEFADYWAMKWSDLLRVKSEFPINLWPNAVQAYHRWIHECLENNKPYDRFAYEMLTASGSNFRVAPVNFYRAMQGNDPKTIAKTVALTFMGTRTDGWPKEKLLGFAGFFSQLGYKGTAEWKEQIVFFDPSAAAAAAKEGILPPKLFPDGTPATIGPDQDPREVFANWLIRPDNPWFARAVSNRVWAWMLGTGIVQEPDDIRPDNPPGNPELLAYLESELVKAHYDLKHLYRLILNSQVYQLSPIPRADAKASEVNFACYKIRRVEAEVLIDALNQITGTTEKYSSPIPEPFTFIPEDQRSITLADGSITSSFLELFGRSSRDTGLESERNSRASSTQSLHMLNSSHIQRKIEQSTLLRSLNRFQNTPRAAVNEVYLSILSRFPTEQEIQLVAGYTGKSNAKGREVMIDLMWALINSPEFMFRH